MSKPNTFRITKQNLKYTKDKKEVKLKKQALSSIGKVISILYDRTLKRTDKKSFGTGCLIRQNMVLTCAHAIFFSDENRVGDSIEFIPSQFLEEKSEHSRTLKVKNVYFPSQFCSGEQSDQLYYDYAVLLLQDNDVIQQDQVLKFSEDYEYQQLQTRDLLIAGFPSPQQNDTLVSQERKANQQNEQRKIIYEHETDEGYSGTPLLLKNENKTYEIIGIHLGKILDNQTYIRKQLGYGLSLPYLKVVIQAMQFEEDYKVIEHLQNSLDCFNSKFVKKVIMQKTRSKSLRKTIVANPEKNSFFGNLERISFVGNLVKPIYSNAYKISPETLLRQKDHQFKNQLQQELQKHFAKEPSWRIEFQNELKQLKELPPQHNQQLLFLVDIYNKQNQILTDKYGIDSEYKNTTGPAKFILIFSRIQKRIDFTQFLSFNNWNHIVQLLFTDCEWFNDDDWRALVKNALNFVNLKKLYLYDNKITEIKEGDIEQFRSMEQISLYYNPLRKQSIQVLKRLKQKNNKMKIRFDD